MDDQKKSLDPDKITVSDTAAPDIVDGLEMAINDVAIEYINNLDNPDEIYENNGLFVGMLKYIYRQYVFSILRNNKGVNNRYDYKLLDNLFNIYTDLVYRYKKNKQPYINEFCIFLNLNRDNLYNIRYGNVKKATPDDIQSVKRWFVECEQGLLNTDSVGAIFRLKSMFNYNDNLAPVPIGLQAAALTADQLPDFKQLNIAKNALPDNKTDNKKQG